MLALHFSYFNMFRVRKFEDHAYQLLQYCRGTEQIFAVKGPVDITTNNCIIHMAFFNSYCTSSIPERLFTLLNLRCCRVPELQEAGCGDSAAQYCSGEVSLRLFILGSAGNKSVNSS